MFLMFFYFFLTLFLAIANIATADTISYYNLSKNVTEPSSTLLFEHSEVANQASQLSFLDFLKLPVEMLFIFFRIISFRLNLFQNTLANMILNAFFGLGAYIILYEIINLIRGRNA